MFSHRLRHCVFIELIVQFETIINEQHVYKLTKYECLVHQHQLSSEILVEFFAVEVGSGGFKANPNYTMLKQLNLSNVNLNRAVMSLRAIIESTSCWTWKGRDDQLQI